MSTNHFYLTFYKLRVSSSSDFFRLSQSAHVQKQTTVPEISEQRRRETVAQHFWSDTETAYMLEELKDLNILHLLDQDFSTFGPQTTGGP